MKDYIVDRLDNQIKWYSKKSAHYKKFYYGFSIAILVISSLTTVLSYLSLKYKDIDFFAIAGTVLSASVPVILGIDKLMKCQELYTTYRTTCERLKQEKILFQTETGEYDGLLSEERNKLLINRCESIMSHENSNWSQLNEKKNN